MGWAESAPGGSSMFYASGSLSAAGAEAGTTGLAGATGSIRWYAEPSSGRLSASPLFGQYAIARSACAPIGSKTRRRLETALPSSVRKIPNTVSSTSSGAISR